ncbi:MAG: glycosyltransferase, partial [Candidatus Hodarchaeales archaeon]
MFDLEDNFMRILYWTPQFWPEIGGIPILAMKALPVLKEYGHDILVVTSRVGSGQPDRGEYKSIPIRRFRFWEALKKNDVSLILKITKQITELKKTYRPDVIHIDFSGYTAFFQQATAKFYACPTVVSVHGDLTSLKTGSDTTLHKL